MNPQLNSYRRHNRAIRLSKSAQGVIFAALLLRQGIRARVQGINGGNYPFVSLPNSKVEIDIPIYFQSPGKGRPDESVVLDIVVKRDPSDISGVIDREIEAILKMIKR